jgi:hypothetical protein
MMPAQTPVSCDATYVSVKPPVMMEAQNSKTDGNKTDPIVPKIANTPDLTEPSDSCGNPVTCD